MVAVAPQPPHSSASAYTSAPAFAANAIGKTHATFEIAIKELECFRVLGIAELDMLEPWRDHMTYPQLTSVITKMNPHSVDLETELAWRAAQENKKRDSLELDLDQLFGHLRNE